MTTATVAASDSPTFTPTKFSTAANKQSFYDWIIRFIKSGCDVKLFNNGKYRQLCQMFQHIAHYDMHGFIAQWFESDTSKALWINNILSCPCYGDPAWTWSDVEKAVQQWLRSNDEWRKKFPFCN